MPKVLYNLLLIFFIFTGGCEQPSSPSQPNGSVVRIAIVAPLSGPDQKSGENVVSGAQTNLTMFPYLGDGTKVELVAEDNGGTKEGTLSALKRIHEQKDIAGVLLMAKSDIILPIVPLADHYQIPILALIATHPDITEGNDFIAQLGFDDIYQGAIAALYIRDEMLIDRVAVFSDPGNVHYSYLAREFMRKFSSVGGEVARHLTVDPAQIDLRVVLEQLREDEVQVLYLAVNPENVLQIAKAAREISWNPDMMGSDGLLSTIFLQYGEDIGFVNGMMATDFYSTNLPSTEYGRRVIGKFKKLYSERGTTYTALASEGTSILQQAIDRCETKTDRNCVNTTLRDTDEFEGLFGKISIHRDGKAERPIFVNIIKDGKLEFLVKVY